MTEDDSRWEGEIAAQVAEGRRRQDAINGQIKELNSELKETRADISTLNATVKIVGALTGILVTVAIAVLNNLT